MGTADEEQVPLEMIFFSTNECLLIGKEDRTSVVKCFQ